MAALAQRLAGAKLAAIYASDLTRTQQSAEILARPHGLRPVWMPELREFAMGRWEGLTGEEIRALDPGAFARWMADVAGYQFPGGESLTELAARAWPAFGRIVAAHAGASVAIVAHGGTNRLVLCRALGLGPERLLALGQDYAGLSILEETEGCWTLRVLNDRGALTG